MTLKGHDKVTNTTLANALLATLQAHQVWSRLDAAYRIGAPWYVYSVTPCIIIEASFTILHSGGKVHLFVCLSVRLCVRLFRDSSHKN